MVEEDGGAMQSYTFHPNICLLPNLCLKRATRPQILSCYHIGSICTLAISNAQGNILGCIC